MSDICINLDVVIRYIHNELNHQEKILFFNHITKCPKCLEELKVMINLNKVLNEGIKKVPNNIKKDAFNKVKEVNNIKKINNITNDLVNTFKTTPNVSIKVLTNILSNIKDLVSLSLIRR